MKPFKRDRDFAYLAIENKVYRVPTPAWKAIEEAFGKGDQDSADELMLYILERAKKEDRRFALVGHLDAVLYF